MDKRPIRRRFRDNPYILNSIKDKNIYIINFYDNKGVMQKVEVSREVFNLFDENEKFENARFYEYSKHLLHENFNSEVIASDYSLEDEVISALKIKELKKELNNLTIVQKRRIIKYYFYDMTLDEIAKEEKCTKMAVKFSIDSAINKISKKLKK